jgi:hypothetical protein
LSNYPLEVQAFFGLADAATSLAWSPNAVDLARGGLNGEISIWDVQTGELIDNIRAGIAVKSLAYSPYGGRLAYGGTIPSDSSALSSNQTDISDAGETLAGGAVHIVVPAPSLERLQAVADACNAPTAVERALPTSAVASQLSTFVANVEALPENTIPPACAADLVAVAEALQSR